MDGRKVLIVDDDKDFVRLTAQKISQAGYEVLTAYDGFQAIRLAHRQNPDLIVLDVKLPAGGGIGTLKNLKDSVNTQNIPVIVITAYDKPDIRREVLEFNVEEFMVKPFAPEKLIEKIWKYVRV